VAFAIGNGETAKGVVCVHQSVQQVALEKIEIQDTELSMAYKKQKYEKSTC